jgi:hypothetical protein
VNAVGIGALVVFMLAWLAGVASWFVGVYHMMRFWVDSFNGTRGRHFVQFLKAGGVFVGCVLLGMVAGVIGDWLGNWSEGWP